MSRRSLRPQLNQIRGWVRQGRTDAWIAHQLDVTVQQIQAFKREQDLESDGGEPGAAFDDTPCPGAARGTGGRVRRPAACMVSIAASLTARPGFPMISAPPGTGGSNGFAGGDPAAPAHLHIGG